jgi:hypothetical protein
MHLFDVDWDAPVAGGGDAGSRHLTRCGRAQIDRAGESVGEERGMFERSILEDGKGGHVMV